MAEWTTEDVQRQVLRGYTLDAQVEIIGRGFDAWLAAHDAEVEAEALTTLPLDGLRQAVRVLRGIEHHWSADSVAEVVTLIERAAAIRGEGS